MAKKKKRDRWWITLPGGKRVYMSEKDFKAATKNTHPWF